MRFMSLLNCIYNERCAEMEKEGALIDVMGLDFGTEGRKEFEEKERGT